MASNKENIAAGFALQKRICEKYNLEIDETKRNVFNRFQYDNVERLDSIIDEIFKVIRWKPRKSIKYIGGNEEGALNYILSWNKTLSIRMAKKYAPPRIVGQPGFELINYFFSDIFGKEVATQDDIRKVFSDVKVLSEVIPIMLKYLLMSDYNVFVMANDSIEIINKLENDIALDESKITISNSEDYPHISYDGISIVEITYYRTSTYVFRFNVKNINRFLECVPRISKNSERGRLGTATEKTICNIYNIDNNLSYRNEELIVRLTPYVKKALEVRYIKPDFYTGTLTGEDKIVDCISKRTGNPQSDLIRNITGFGASARSAVDFFAQKKALSVKTTSNSSFLVCPDTIGQPSAGTCKIFFDKVWEGFSEEITPVKFIDIVMDKNKLVDLIRIYIEYLFECDYLFWVKYIERIDSYEIKILDRNIEGEKAVTYEWDKELFEFMHTKEEFIKKATITSHCHGTNQLNYGGIRLGQFDVFKRDGRYTYEFRFNLQNLLDITNIKQ